MAASYAQIRLKLATGHVILWRGNSPLSRIIRLWSEFSHASLVVRLSEYQGLRNRVFIVEALSSGLELRLLSRRMAGYNGRVFALTPELSELEQDVMGSWALRNCAMATPYDFTGLIGNIFGRVSADARRFFCSEFVYTAHVRARRALPLKRAPRPGDLPKWLRGALTEINVATVPEEGMESG